MWHYLGYLAAIFIGLSLGIMGLQPLLLASKGFSLTQIGTVAVVYPAVWGSGQLADRLYKKDLLF